MGLVTMGPPGDIVLELARLGNARVFVETGTFQGATAHWASSHFDSVFTIERDENLYALHHEALRQLPGVTPMLGDSREILPSIVAQLGDRSAVFWLDGHWSGEGTAGAGDECPLLGELACLAMRASDVVLIDDARLFLCAPPRPHRPSQWPGIAEVVDGLSGPHGRPFLQIVDDVIFAVPDRDPFKGRLIDYAQDRAGVFWRNYAELQRGASRKGESSGLLGAIKRHITSG